MYPVRTMCRVLGVSTSGYYAWLRRPPSARERRDEELKALVSESHARSDGTYGTAGIHEDLKEAACESCEGASVD